MTIPLWKLNRELRRIGNQIVGAPYLVFDIYERLMEPFWRYQHRKEFNARVSVDDGQVAETQRVVIFLIYQPGGVAQSTISLCENMIALGFSPFIVSNAPLSPADRDRIDAVAWKVMERPNFGYDFGGYQDALFVLRDLKDTLEYLIIMNDSVWLEFTPDLWERLVAEDKDVVGLIQEEKKKSVEDKKLEIELRNIQSYFFLIQGDMWKSKIFWSYWANYKMINNKKRTIKNGEIGFTEFLINSKIKCGGLITTSKFLKKIEKADTLFILTTLKYSSYTNSELRRDNRNIIESYSNCNAWRSRAISHIERSLERAPLNGTYWMATCRLFNVNLIKKNRQPLYCLMRQQYLAAFNDGAVLPLPPNIATELAQAVTSEQTTMAA